ncbi:NAD(P)-binding domain-containing protein [Paraburkholderia fungorum]|uniref:NAD(P)-binding domain-containing protein n=1 Tax=Paraburkholderia fungorum TaxID=134537 RepID=UPI001FC9289D|nr:NAD(P)-binding domain-containing protein [Paraburkholderia fungorum]
MRAWHKVRVANSRGPDTLSALATETGARAVTGSDAVREVDLVILTVPEARVRELPKDLFSGSVLGSSV